MTNWTIQNIPLPVRSAYKVFIPEEYQGFLSVPETELLIAAAENEPCGALLARTSNERYEIVSLFVAESHRNEGAASELVHAAERSAVSQGFGTLDVCYSAAEEDLEKLRDFYVHRGFFFPREGACLYSIPIERLAGSSLAGLPEITEKAAHHIVPVSAIPFADARVTYSYLTQKLPVEMTAAYAPGDVLDDYSVAYVTETDILSFVIFSAEDHILYLHCAYADNPQAGKACIALLRYNYERLMKEEPGRFTTFRITTVNSASDKLAQKLLAGCEPQVLHVCYTQKPLVRFTPVAPGFGGVLVRTNALHDALITHGVSISLCMNPGALPYLIWSPRDKLVIELSYTAENDTYTSFTLAAQYMSEVPDEAFEQLAQAMADDPGPAMLVRDATERTATLIGVLYEGAIFREEYTIDEFLVPFVDQVERLLEFLLTHSVFGEKRDERK